LIEDLSKERAESILEELSIPQLADLFSDLPHDDATELMQLLPEEQAERLEQVLHEHEAEARKLMSSEYLAFAEEATIAEALRRIRSSAMDPETISYVYVVAEDILTGVVDIRELILTPDDSKLGDIMSTSVVSAEEDKTRTDLEEIFGKYNFRMVPVVDKEDRLLGIIRYNDLIQSADQNT
jgi:magnesium transporter